MGTQSTWGSVTEMFREIFLLSISLTVSCSLPGWEDLQCEEGHKYLFSDIKLTWQDAREECELYGGWLLSINSQREQNCLVRFAHSSGLQADYFWHDATSAADQGVRVHAKDNSELKWTNPVFHCDSEHWYRGYDYYVLGLFGETDRRTGAWCDTADNDSLLYFICEGMI